MVYINRIFSPLAKIGSVWLLISLAGTHHMTTQLDIKNAFFHDIFDEQVYIEQPLGFVAQGSMAKFVI